MTLNTFAEIVRGWIAQSYKTTRFVVRRRPGDDDDLEASVRAPRGSRAGALAIYTDRGNLWVRFAPPNMHYPIDDRAELSTIVRSLLNDRAVFVATYRGTDWRGTTVMRPGVSPPLRRGERADIVSWSGRFDATVTAGR